MKAIALGQHPDRVPFFLSAMGFCAQVVGYPIARIFDDPEKSVRAQIWTQEMFGSDGGPSYSFSMSIAWDFGGGIKFPTSQWQQVPEVDPCPVQSEADVERLEVPDVKTAPAIQHAMEFSKTCQQNHRPIMFSIGSPFTGASSLCGLDQLCRWMLKKPELAHKLLRVTTDFCLQVAQYWADTFGAQRVTPFVPMPAESNDVISPKQFEEFAFPYMKELCEKALAMGIRRFSCHVCGEQNLNLPLISRIPMGKSALVSFGHQVDLTTAIEHFGDKCIIVGNIEPAIIQNGTPEQVYELCHQAIDKAKYAPNGFVLCPGCELPPMAPPYNVYMLKKAVMDFGWYD
ncbi:Uroporphyrinogen decarboxylase [subsurface metagenome]